MSVLNLRLVKVEGIRRQDLLDALARLSEMDADFCGENGSEYLWDCVDETKYSSNMDYLLNTLKNLRSDKELIERFVSLWLDKDTYYLEHILEVTYDKTGKAECIALATMS
jgi:hypothetical protein